MCWITPHPTELTVNFFGTQDTPTSLSAHGEKNDR